MKLVLDVPDFEVPLDGLGIEDEDVQGIALACADALVEIALACADALVEIAEARIAAGDDDGHPELMLRLAQHLRDAVDFAAVVLDDELVDVADLGEEDAS